MSKNEWFFYQALEKDQLTYIYQYRIGIAGTRGSQAVDFLITGVPGGAKACFIQGSYWHRAKTAEEDRIKHIDAAQVFGPNNVFDFSEEETESMETARRHRREKIGL